MRNFHRWTIALSAAALVGLFASASTTARAENNHHPQIANSAPARGDGGLLNRLREQVRRVNASYDGCR